MNRYFIAHLPRGPIEGYHRALVADVANRFSLENSSAYFPTHFTIKAPFEADDVAAVKSELELFAKTYQASPYAIRGFGHFGNQVVFLDVELSKESGIRELQSSLKNVLNISWGEYEPLKIFHITVASKDLSKKFDAVWDTLADRQIPHFAPLFDNVALLRKESGVWVVDSIYYLNL